MTPDLDDWDEPDPGLLADLTQQAMYAAGAEAMRPGRPSRVPAPDGSQQGETLNERDTRVVRAALRMLLGNRLVTAVPEDRRPEWLVMNPPPPEGAG